MEFSSNISKLCKIYISQNWIILTKCTREKKNDSSQSFLISNNKAKGNYFKISGLF